MSFFGKVWRKITGAAKEAWNATVPSAMKDVFLEGVTNLDWNIPNNILSYARVIKLINDLTAYKSKVSKWPKLYKADATLTIKFIDSVVELLQALAAILIILPDAPNLDFKGSEPYKQLEKCLDKIDEKCNNPELKDITYKKITNDISEYGVQDVTVANVLIGDLAVSLQQCTENTLDELRKSKTLGDFRSKVYVDLKGNAVNYIKDGKKKEIKKALDNVCKSSVLTYIKNKIGNIKDSVSKSTSDLVRDTGTTLMAGTIQLGAIETVTFGKYFNKHIARLSDVALKIHAEEVLTNYPGELSYYAIAGRKYIGELLGIIKEYIPLLKSLSKPGLTNVQILEKRQRISELLAKLKKILEKALKDDQILKVKINDYENYEMKNFKDSAIEAIKNWYSGAKKGKAYSNEATISVEIKGGHEYFGLHEGHNVLRSKIVINGWVLKDFFGKMKACVEKTLSDLNDYIIKNNGEVTYDLLRIKNPNAKIATSIPSKTAAKPSEVTKEDDKKLSAEIASKREYLIKILNNGISLIADAKQEKTKFDNTVKRENFKASVYGEGSEYYKNNIKINVEYNRLLDDYVSFSKTTYNVLGALGADKDAVPEKWEINLISDNKVNRNSLNTFNPSATPYPLKESSAALSEIITHCLKYLSEMKKTAKRLTQYYEGMVKTYGSESKVIGERRKTLADIVSEVIEITTTTFNNSEAILGRFDEISKALSKSEMNDFKDEKSVITTKRTELIEQHYEKVGKYKLNGTTYTLINDKDELGDGINLLSSADLKDAISYCSEELKNIKEMSAEISKLEKILEKNFGGDIDSLEKARKKVTEMFEEAKKLEQTAENIRGEASSAYSSIREKSNLGTLEGLYEKINGRELTSIGSEETDDGLTLGDYAKAKQCIAKLLQLVGFKSKNRDVSLANVDMAAHVKTLNLSVLKSFMDEGSELLKQFKVINKQMNKDKDVLKKEIQKKFGVYEVSLEKARKKLTAIVSEVIEITTSTSKNLDEILGRFNDISKALDGIALTAFNTLRDEVKQKFSVSMLTHYSNVRNCKLGNTTYTLINDKNQLGTDITRLSVADLKEAISYCSEELKNIKQISADISKLEKSLEKNFGGYIDSLEKARKKVTEMFEEAKRLQKDAEEIFAAADFNYGTHCRPTPERPERVKKDMKGNPIENDLSFKLGIDPKEDYPKLNGLRLTLENDSKNIRGCITKLLGVLKIGGESIPDNYDSTILRAFELEDLNKIIEEVAAILKEFKNLNKTLEKDLTQIEKEVEINKGIYEDKANTLIDVLGEIIEAKDDALGKADETIDRFKSILNVLDEREKRVLKKYIVNLEQYKTKVMIDYASACGNECKDQEKNGKVEMIIEPKEGNLVDPDNGIIKIAVVEGLTMEEMNDAIARCSQQLDTITKVSKNIDAHIKKMEKEYGKLPGEVEISREKGIEIFKEVQDLQTSIITKLTSIRTMLGDKTNKLENSDDVAKFTNDCAFIAFAACNPLIHILKPGLGKTTVPYDSSNNWIQMTPINDILEIQSITDYMEEVKLVVLKSFITQGKNSLLELRKCESKAKSSEAEIKKQIEKNSIPAEQKTKQTLSANTKELKEYLNKIIAEWEGTKKFISKLEIDGPTKKAYLTHGDIVSLKEKIDSLYGDEEKAFFTYNDKANSFAINPEINSIIVTLKTSDPVLSDTVTNIKVCYKDIEEMAEEFKRNVRVGLYRSDWEKEISEIIQKLDPVVENIESHKLAYLKRCKVPAVQAYVALDVYEKEFDDKCKEYDAIFNKKVLNGKYEFGKIYNEIKASAEALQNLDSGKLEALVTCWSEILENLTAFENKFMVWLMDTLKKTNPEIPANLDSNKLKEFLDGLNRVGADIEKRANKFEIHKKAIEYMLDKLDFKDELPPAFKTQWEQATKKYEACKKAYDEEFRKIHDTYGANGRGVKQSIEDTPTSMYDRFINGVYSNLQRVVYESDRQLFKIDEDILEYLKGTLVPNYLAAVESLLQKYEQNKHTMAAYANTSEYDKLFSEQKESCDEQAKKLKKLSTYSYTGMSGDYKNMEANAKKFVEECNQAVNKFNSIIAVLSDALNDEKATAPKDTKPEKSGDESGT